MIVARLRMLQLVAHYGTVTAAAHALHYTPSAASYQLRQLAGELGVELLHRHGRGITLTAAAHTLLRHTEVLHAQAARAYAELAVHADEPGVAFTLCGFSTAANRLLPPAAARLRDRHPRLAVRVIEAEPAPCFDLLLTGEADLALVIDTINTPPARDTRFDQQPLLDDPLDLVVPAGHPLTEQKRVRLADAADQSWIVGRSDSAYHQLTVAACHAAGFTPQIDHYADEWGTGTALVAQHFGVFLVPRLAELPHDAPVTRLPLHGDPTPARRILTVTRSGGRDHPLAQHALEEVSFLAAAIVPQ